MIKTPWGDSISWNQEKILDYPSGPNMITCVCAKSLQLFPALCDSMDCSPPGSFVLEILQARILEWFAYLPPGNLPDPGNESVALVSPALPGGFFTTRATWEALPMYSPHTNRTEAYFPLVAHSVKNPPAMWGT